MANPQSFDRLLWRAADQIHDRLNPGNLPLTDLLVPETSWSHWQVCLHRISRARNRRWTGAVETVRQQALETLTELRARLEDCRNALTLHSDKVGVSSVGDIYRDLVALRDEFPQVAVEFSNGSVSVTTEPVVLEGMDLGPFEIKLSWTEACAPLRRRHAPPCRSQSTLRRRRTPVDPASVATGPSGRLLSDRAADSANVQLRQRVCPTRSMVGTGMSRLRNGVERG